VHLSVNESLLRGFYDPSSRIARLAWVSDHAAFPEWCMVAGHLTIIFDHGLEDLVHPVSADHLFVGLGDRQILRVARLILPVPDLYLLFRFDGRIEHRRATAPHRW